MKKILSLLSLLIPAIVFGQNLPYRIDVGGKNYRDKFGPITYYIPGAGIKTSGTPVTNFPITALDSTEMYFSTVSPYVGGGKQGGVIMSSLPGADSIMVWAPYCLLMGSSLDEGHSHHHGRLHPNGTNAFIWNYPDSAGQLSYYLQQITNMRWYNQGIGGQTSYDIVKRWGRDVLHDSINNVLDGRGPKTLGNPSYPLIVIYDGVGNDIGVAGNTPQGTIDNICYMAASCQQHGILFICAISTTTTGTTLTNDQYCQAVNKFLESGGLNPFGAVCFDLRKNWSDPAYGYDGTHQNTAYVQSDAHYTTDGYDTLANALKTETNMPILRQMILRTNVAPANPVTQLNYISAATIDGQPYGSLTQNDTFNITRPFGMDSRFVYDCGDSITIKATAVSTIVGTGNNYGLGIVKFVLDNTYGRPDSLTTITRWQMRNQGVMADLNYLTKIKIHRENNNDLTTPAIQVLNASGSADGFDVIPGSTTKVMVNGATPIAAETVNSNGDFNTNSHAVISNGAANQIGNFQIGGGGSAHIGALSLGMVDYHSAATLPVGMSLETFYGSTLNCASEGIGTAGFAVPITTGTIGSQNKGLWVWNGSGSNSSSSSYYYGMLVQNFLNDAAGTGTGKTFVNSAFKPYIIASNGYTRFFNIRADSLDNTLNAINGTTMIGDSNADHSAKLQVTSTTAGVLIPRMNTTQMNAISSPANGLMVYNLDSACLCDNTGTSGSPIWRKDGGTTSSGTYTVTITPVSNCTYSSTTVGHWVRVGNQVTVNVPTAISVTTGATITDFTMSLPISSTISIPNDVAGTGTISAASTIGVSIIGNTTTHTADVQFVPTPSGGLNVYTQFTYTID